MCIGSPFPGNEEHLEKMLHLARELGIENQLIYTGDVDDIHAAYCALDVSILASVRPSRLRVSWWNQWRWEGQSLEPGSAAHLNRLLMAQQEFWWLRMTRKRWRRRSSG